ncbi:MAG TPA: lytic transglycosylase domain-containing protein [Acidimicrobiales bacterium]|nr:lytic transglycosylase domain-containing protein [Acidimicrobiales bacterium]
MAVKTGGRAAELAVTAVRLARTAAEATASPFTTAAKLGVRVARRHPWIIAALLVPPLLSLLLTGGVAYILFQSASDMMNTAAAFTGVAAGSDSTGQSVGQGGIWCPDQEMMQQATQIPAPALAAYCLAASRVGVDWSILAGIGHRECAHGTNREPGCNPDIPSAVNPEVPEVNHAGARGPMQFLGSTWDSGKDTFDPDVARPPIPEGQEHRGYASDGDGDGIADPWSFPDAAVAAARLLKNNGVHTDPRNAVYRYNPSWDYVDFVLEAAQQYRADVAHLLPGLPAPAALDDVDTTPYSESRIRPVTQRMLDEVIPRFGRGYGVGCWRDENGSDHQLGLACDFMMASPANTMPTPEYQAHGSALAFYLIANADRLDVEYVIWWKRIWTRQSGEWREYTRYDPHGTITLNHYDHVHVSLHTG